MHGLVFGRTCGDSRIVHAYRTLGPFGYGTPICYEGIPTLVRIGHAGLNCPECLAVIEKQSNQDP